VLRWFYRLLFSNSSTSEKRHFLTDSEQLMSNKYLIVGLGNPGRKYRGNRHNIGFMALDRIAATLGIVSDRVEQKAIVGKQQTGEKLLILAKPQTFMNSSGEAVSALINYYKIPLENVLIIYDELDLPLGTVRLRSKGSAAGHNGMRSLIQHIGQNFARMRLGIGRPPGKMPVPAFVLQDFHASEEPVVDELLTRAVSAAQTFVQEGIDIAMSRHNSQLEQQNSE
jgi:PTH1 family peptidyl-tRNA hydrolase